MKNLDAKDGTTAKDMVKLDTLLIYNILDSIFYHAEILNDTADHGPESDILLVLAHDAERRIAQIFAQINAQHPGIMVERPKCNQETSHFFLP